MHWSTIVGAVLFWASMIVLIVGIYQYDGPGDWPWFVVSAVLLASAYALRAWARRYNPPSGPPFGG